MCSVNGQIYRYIMFNMLCIIISCYANQTGLCNVMYNVIMKIFREVLCIVEDFHTL